MRDRIQEALKRSRADYTEIRIEEKESTRVVFQGKDLEDASGQIDKGGIVQIAERNVFQPGHQKSSAEGIRL